MVGRNSTRDAGISFLFITSEQSNDDLFKTTSRLGRDLGCRCTKGLSSWRDSPRMAAASLQQKIYFPMTKSKVGRCQCCGFVAQLFNAPSRFGEETWACDECWNPDGDKCGKDHPNGGGKVTLQNGGVEGHAPEGSVSVAVRGLRQRRPRDMEAAGS
jgi:hypothetical protein